MAKKHADMAKKHDHIFFRNLIKLSVLLKFKLQYY
jgi:hypothetical protein